MKAYILYIATLLAALVLPATAQTGSTDTKTAPDFPSMPYKLTVNNIDNHGKVDITDKNATADKNGIVTIAPDTLVYGNQDTSKTTIVALKITPNEGYTLDEGYPKAYKTGDPTKTVAIAMDTFAMPSHPVTLDVKYTKIDDLDLSKLTGDVILTYTFDESNYTGTWTYKAGAGRPTSFTGTLKGKGTCNLKITSSNGGYPGLSLANGTELTGNIEVAVAEGIELGLGAKEAGTVATVIGNITVANNSSLKCYVDIRLNIYGKVEGSGEITGLMQWTWTTAPASGKTVTIYTPLEEVLTTFTANGTQTTFATNYSYGTPAKVEVKVKVGDEIQKDSNSKITFLMDNVNGYLTSFTGMEDSEQKPAEQPKDVDGITITGEDTYKEGKDPASGASDKPFSGTITGDISTIKIDAAVTNNPVIILNDVKKKGSTDNTVEVADQAKVTLALKGTANEVSTMTVAAGGILTLTTVADGASFAKNTPPTITNSGTFISETRLIKKVGGDAPLNVTSEPVGKAIAKDETYTLKVEANNTVGTKAMTRSTDLTLSYQWQKYTTEYGWVKTGGDSATYTTTKVGTYRCIVTSQKGAVTTTLTTQTAEVTLKSDPDPNPDPDPDPDPTPTYYTVTLPAAEGFTTNPAAGVYTVEEGYSFSFSLTVDEGYRQHSIPVVTSSSDGTPLEPRPSDNMYVILSVYEDTDISVAGIVKDTPPTSNEPITTDKTRIWSESGLLFIHTDNAKNISIYTFDGVLKEHIYSPDNDIQVSLKAGTYLIVVDTKAYKVLVR